MNPLKRLFKPQVEEITGNRTGQKSELVVNLSENPIIDNLAPGSMDFTRDDNVCFSATEWTRIWYVRRWPRDMDYKSWEELLRLPADVRVSLFMEPLPPGLVANQLERREVAIQSKRFMRAYQRRDPSPSEDRLYQEIKEERQNIEINQDPFYYLTVVIGLYADSEASLDAWSEELERYCRNIGLVIDRAKWDQEKGLNALLPFNMNTLGDRRRNARLDALTNTYPWIGDEIVMPQGIFYGYDTQTQMGVVLDPFVLENPNCIIIGTSGGGKSYWMKDSIEQYLLDGVRIFVLDIEDEYRHLCNDLGGAYLDMGIESQHKVNVLDVDPGEPDGLGGALEAFKGWLVSVLRRPCTPEEEEALDKAYFHAFAKMGIGRDDRSALSKTPPLLSDLYESLRYIAQTDVNQAAASRLASAIYPMAQGGLAHAFNCNTNIDVRNNPLVVFGLSSVYPSMMPRRIRQIQQFTWSQIKPGRRTIEIVDEAWWLLSSPETADDLCARARRFRKKNAALFVATQHPEDFSANRHAHTILSLVGTHMLFQQNDTFLSQIASIFMLNDAEKQAIGTLEPGHYFLKTSKLRMLLYRPILQARHQLYTTRPDEMMGLEERGVKG